jgi:hypothetical protein
MRKDNKRQTKLSRYQGEEHDCSIAAKQKWQKGPRLACCLISSTETNSSGGIRRNSRKKKKQTTYKRSSVSVMK